MEQVVLVVLVVLAVGYIELYGSVQILANLKLICLGGMEGVRAGAGAGKSSAVLLDSRALLSHGIWQLERSNPILHR
jgi:hypothetical protein